MIEPCIPLEELARAASLPGTDPGRRHLDTCPRCQARLALIRDFEAPGDEVRLPDPASADARMLETIANLTGIASSSPVRSPAARVRGGSGWRSFLTPRPIWAFAAIAIAVGAVVWTRIATPPATQMRSTPATIGAIEPSLEASEPRSVDGGLELSWSPFPGADHYRVVFFDTSLREIARTDSSADTHAVLRAASLPAGLRHGASVGWRVEALADGDRIANSSPGVLRVP